MKMKTDATYYTSAVLKHKKYYNTVYVANNIIFQVQLFSRHK